MVDRIITELCVFDVDKVRVHFPCLLSLHTSRSPTTFCLPSIPPSPFLQVKGELVLVELFPGVTVEEVRAKTGADFREAKGGVKVVKV